MKRLEVNQTIIPEKKGLLHHWEKVLESGKLTNNQVEVQSFENELEVSCHRSHALAVSSGTMALHLLIRALDLPKGEIIVPAFSFVATASAPLWEGYNVVLCDIDPNTLCLDPSKVAARISSNTRAILGVHVFGQPCAVEKLEALGNKHGIPVIYDGAHAMGSMLHNKSLLAYGLASMTSLHTSKIVSSIEGARYSPTMLYCTNASSKCGISAETHPIKMNYWAQMQKCMSSVRYMDNYPLLALTRK